MTTITQAKQKVDAFHDHCKLKRSAKIDEPITNRDYIVDLLKLLHSEAKLLMNCLDDTIGLRLHLELEELAEKFQALLDGDEVAFLDGAADQLYVQLGTAAIYDLPLQEAFDEVHRSNMTKEKQPDDPHAQRLRSKGPNYRAPNLRGILGLYRNQQGNESLKDY